jgi:N-acetylmuramoyl-L-alanine amidase
MRARVLWVLLITAACLLPLGAGGYSYMHTINPTGIVIHHSTFPPGSPPGFRLDADGLDAIHKERGFGIFYWGRVYHIGYHYVILPDGTVQQGRPEHCEGAHTLGQNSYLGICLIGDFSTAHNPDGERGLRRPTSAQMRALLELSARLRETYGIPPERVFQHRDLNPDTECPGDRFPVQEFYEGLRRAPAGSTPDGRGL